MMTGFLCRTCGSKTNVVETRGIGGALRRRRQCSGQHCPARFTTFEIQVPGDVARSALAGSGVTLVPRAILEKAHEVMRWIEQAFPSSDLGAEEHW